MSPDHKQKKDFKKTSFTQLKSSHLIDISQNKRYTSFLSNGLKMTSKEHSMTTKSNTTNTKKRYTCNGYSIKDSGTTIRLMGWVDTVRDHGHLLFIHLRDVSGIIQLVFDPEQDDKCHKLAQSLRSEYVIDIQGTIRERSKDTKNPHIATGDIEVLCDSLTLLNSAETPPFIVTEKDQHDDHESNFNVDEELRLTYRYLDLRRPRMQHNIISRYRITKAIRDVLDTKGFFEIETPVLTKSTPEGARDYLVPSRTHDHKFFALPQSPQLFKQLLMASGFERYFQITKCFRDEDLRPNRQPEFTQVDLEASFIDEEDIYSLLEILMVEVFKTQGIKLATPFKRLPYKKAIETYGSDSPDLRYGLEFVDVSSLLTKCNYKIFNMILSGGGLIKGFNIKGHADLLGKNLLQNEFAKTIIPKFGGKGMTWMKIIDGKLQSNIVQFFNDEEQAALISAMGGEDGDVLIFVADTDHDLVHSVLGKFRCFIAERQGLINPDLFVPCWVTDFPLFELRDGQLSSVHHPFTQPSQDITGLSKEELLTVTSRGYDLVFNGEEVGGGSIRIHKKEVQDQIFTLLGLSKEEIEEKFGFFVKALSYGCPPHGGLALGLDRLVSMILKTSSIREVIAFPKNRVAYCPLTESPSEVSTKQLDNLQLNLKPIPPKT